MTISPPAKVKKYQFEKFTVLTSGIDTMNLSLDVVWESASFFDLLKHMQEEAIKAGKELPLTLSKRNENDYWSGLIANYGLKGYKWFLKGSEFNLKIGNWMEPSTKPSVLVEIGSETLWSQGPQTTTFEILDTIESQGGSITSIRPSRIDMCLDLLFPDSLWSDEIRKFAVSRANYIGPHFELKKLTGITFGKGQFVGRIYNKALEIKQKSKKEWFYKVWGIEKVPEGMQVIRVEFQLRREALKELGIDQISDFFADLDKIWSYCTREWLKFQDNPGKHHTQRQTFEWWQVIQDGYLGVQNADPQIRYKAMKAKRRQLIAQIYGFLTSLEALRYELLGLHLWRPTSPETAMFEFCKILKEEGKDMKTFQEDVFRKRHRYHKGRRKNIEIKKSRYVSRLPNKI